MLKISIKTNKKNIFLKDISIDFCILVLIGNFGNVKEYVKKALNLDVNKENRKKKN